MNEPIGNSEQLPVAYRYDFDGHGWLYIDSGSGSNFASLVAKNNGAEPLYTHPVAENYSLTDKQIDEMVVILQQQAKEIEEFRFVLRNLTLATSKKIGELEEELENCTCQGGHSEAYLKIKER
jgi:hypothetical protein